jgi:Uma2 family endonuclease
MPKQDLERLLRRRRAMGGDRYDEVWDGVYVLSPEADNQHQKLSGRLFKALDTALEGDDRFDVYPAINITDWPEKWRRNFRIPDVAVFLSGNAARDRETHWLGGPDFAAEVVSKGDRSRKKFNFYHKVGVRELLLVDRHPWQLELYARGESGFDLVGRSTPEEPAALASAVLPVTFRLAPDEPRPRVEVASADGRTWLA